MGTRLSYIQHYSHKNIIRKNESRKFTTLDFSHVETVRFSLELLESAATTNLQTFAKIFFFKNVFGNCQTSHFKNRFFLNFYIFLLPNGDKMATKWRFLR